MHRILLFPDSSFPIASFGLMVGLAILLGAFLNDRRKALAGLDRSGMQDALVYAILGGIVGARLVFVGLNAGWYGQHPEELFNTREGGITWYGGLIGGVLALAWYCRRKRVSLPRVLDVFAPGLLAGHAVGRIGCLLNGCCYGKPSTLPWAVVLTDAGHPINAVTRHPVQLYESLMDVAAMALLLYLERRFRLQNGKVFIAFLALYGTVRFIAEFWREGDPFIVGLTLAQVSSLALAGLSFLTLAINRDTSHLIPHLDAPPKPGQVTDGPV